MIFSAKKIAVICACLSFLTAEIAAVASAISTQNALVLSTTEDRLQTAIKESFPAVPQDEIKISPLTGGYSGAQNFIIEVNGKRYALRLQTYKESPVKIARELYMMQQAAAIGLAPAIVTVSDAGRAILMDFIPGGTLSYQNAKNQDNIRAIGKAIARVHSIPKGNVETIDFESAMQNYFMEIIAKAPEKEDLETAIEIIHRVAPQLRSLQGGQANIHGDLNPRNIFVTNDKVVFIDWSETLWDDPFLDLGYYTVLAGYNSQEDGILLESYLGHPPTDIEQQRYRLAKKLNYARLSLGAYYVVILRMENEGETVSKRTREGGWLEEAQRFSTEGNALNAQFFYDASKAALREALKE